MPWMLGIGLLLLSGLQGRAQAETFSSTNVQLLYGSNFHDQFYGYNTTDGNMTTVTLEHFGTWAYGDNFFFVDLLSGKMAGFDGLPTHQATRIYAEWHPRLSLSKISGRDLSFSVVKDLFVAGQINRSGEGFNADMIGLGANLDLPGFQFAAVNGYLRKDRFNRPTWQVTVAWLLPFGDSPLSLEGYFDFNGTDHDGTEINGQPQLLFDLGASGGLPRQRLKLGVEWYYHRHKRINSSVPQVMVKWYF